MSTLPGVFIADRWRMDYNHYRLHSSLGYMERRRLRRSVVSKAPVLFVLLKSRGVNVKYSHNNWYKKWGRSRL